jgi:hypothetical protein
VKKFDPERLVFSTRGGTPISPNNLLRIKQTQRYLNITDEELAKSMAGVWERRRQLRLAGQSSHGETTGEQAVGQ